MNIIEEMEKEIKNLLHYQQFCLRICLEHWDRLHWSNIYGMFSFWIGSKISSNSERKVWLIIHVQKDSNLSEYYSSILRKWFFTNSYYEAADETFFFEFNLLMDFADFKFFFELFSYLELFSVASLFEMKENDAVDSLSEKNSFSNSF